MELVYAVDVKMKNEGEEFQRILKMDLSCLNILSFSCSYLPSLSQQKFNPETITSPLNTIEKSSSCVYICALEQPWKFSLITISNVPIVQLVWSLDGTYLLVCNQAGVCRIFQMKNDCINSMDHVYTYEIHEDIISAKYMFPRESIIVNLDQYQSFYEQTNSSSLLLKYALNSGNFICVTSSGIIYTLPLNRSSLPFNYFLSQYEPLCASLCDIFPTDTGFNIILGENIQGALVQVFVINYASLEPRLSYSRYRARSFRIPSSYGKLETLVYFQRNGIDCILTHLRSSDGDLIDIYEFSIEQGEWISLDLLNSFQSRITSISSSPNRLLVSDDAYQGLFGRQILITVNDGSIISVDKLNLTRREQCFPMGVNKTSNNSALDVKQCDHFVQIQHTYSGLCCVGFTKTGFLTLLRTINLDDNSRSSSIVIILVHLFEQYIVATDYPCDLWDILCLVSNNEILNELIDRLVLNFEGQTLELKRRHFIRFKECLYHLHRLACPLTVDSLDHLMTLLIYHVLLIVRDYLRYFVYEPANRNFADAAQEILQQPSFMQTIDLKRIKYLGDQSLVNGDTQSIDPNHYQSVSFTTLVNWVCDILYYFIGYLQLQQISSSLIFRNLFTDANQLQWLRELVIYFYILNKMNKIPHSKIAHLQLYSRQKTTNGNEQNEFLKDIYHSLTKFSQIIQAQNTNIIDNDSLEDWSMFNVEMVQSKVDSMFPKSYSFLISNLRVPQKFIRDQIPSFASHLYECSSEFNHISDTQFDIITLGKMSLSSDRTYRRCIRCSNFSRLSLTKPYPLLAYRLNNRCLCGGLFWLHSNSNTSEKLTAK